MRPPIVLLSDFGADSWYVGAMKGAILSVDAGLAIVDLSHGVPPQDIAVGAWLLAVNCAHFPAGSVFLAVVDPQVGSPRRALVGRAGDYGCVAPDNGLLAEFLRRQSRYALHAMAAERLGLPEPSATFQGRDLFAPAAAHLALGRPLVEFGPPCADPELGGVAAPRREGETLVGRIIIADHFGNLITNISAEAIAAFCPAAEDRATRLELRLGDHRILGLRRSYHEAAAGELLALLGSSGFLELALRDGSARASCGAGAGDELRLRVIERGRA